MTALDHTTCNRRQFGIGRQMVSLNFNSAWHWLPLVVALAGYLRAKSDYLDIRVRQIDESALALLMVLIIAGAGGMGIGLRACGRKRPILARWCCLGALSVLWVPPLLMVEGLPKLVTIGLLGSMGLVSCRIACISHPIHQ